jgi:hypothetical protein
MKITHRQSNKNQQDIVTVFENTVRSDRVKTRKINREQLLKAIRAVLPAMHSGHDAEPPKKAALYRLCIEKGLLTRSQITPNTLS